MNDGPALKFHTVAEAAPILRVNEWTVRSYIESGKLKASKPGGVWLIAEADLLEFLATGSNRAAS